jgi:hypothetical protein
MDIKEAIGLNDTSVEFEITSNRPDCLAVIGLARETAATFDRPYTVKEPTYKGIEGDINSMLKVQERLYDVIEEIEALQTKLNLYDGQVAMSTVHLTLREVIVYTEVVDPDPTFGQRVKEAFVESWTDFGRGWQNFFVWFIEAFPTLLVVVGIHAGIFFIIYGSVKRGQKKRAAREAAMAAARAARENAMRGENK